MNNKKTILKVIHNSKTKAATIQLPKKKFPESIRKNFDKIKNIKINLEDLDFDD